jgi:hypothetical protein
MILRNAELRVGARNVGAIYSFPALDNASPSFSTGLRQAR